MSRLLDYLPRGTTVDDAEWERRHRFLLWVLGVQAPVLAVFGLLMGHGAALTLGIAAIPLAAVAAGHLARGRTLRSLFVTAGLTSSCAGLVILADGAIEAHFSFFVIIGFLTLYQHWVPFVWNIAFTVISHGLGSLLVPSLMFNHHMGQHDPWVWSLIHGVAVLLACLGVMIFCRITEDEQRRRITLATRLADAEVRQQEFTSDLLLNLARRNQSMFGRQLDIITDLEERERDPDALAELFRLEHLATRVRRNAESLLVLSGEQPARVWSAPVPLRDVVRAGVAETEDLDRVTSTVDERPRVVGSTVADLTHMVAELTENAARFSPPTSAVRVTTRPDQRAPGAQLLIVEDTGVGMPADQLAAANALLAHAQDVDVSASRRLGFHVVSRLAERHGIAVSLTPTPGCGITAVLVLPAALFAGPGAGPAPWGGSSAPAARPGSVPEPRASSDDGATTGPSTVPTAMSTTGPATGSTPAAGVDGRHSWPGHTGPVPVVEEAADEDEDGRRARPTRSAHARGDDAGADPETAITDDPGAAHSGTAHTGTVTQAAAVRATTRGLIHPIVVPPPPADPRASPNAPAGAPSATPASTPSTAPVSTPGTAPGTAGNGDSTSGDRGAGGTGPVLKRRVPQSHLAPELIRSPPPAASEPVAPARGRTPAATPDVAGAFDALSRYQRSRTAARTEIETDTAAPMGNS